MAAGAKVQWEYRILTGYDTLTEDALNGLGAEGWELVGFSSHVEPHTHVMPDRTLLLCVFKRRKQ